MDKRSSPMLRKPSLSSVVEFAERQGSAPRKRGRPPKGSAPVEKNPLDNSRFPPGGDARLTVNIRKELHRRLKHEAVDRDITVGELIEEMAEKHLKG